MQIAGPGAALAERGGRIAVLRGGREVWRSTEQFRINGVFATVGPQAVAFSYDDFAPGSSGPSLFVARLKRTRTQDREGRAAAGLDRDRPTAELAFPARILRPLSAPARRFAAPSGRRTDARASL